MGFLGWFHRARGEAAEPLADLADLDELTVWLRYKRGENITVVDSAGNIPPNRDAIKHMANAARDGRWIDRTMEDRLISDLTTYRKLS